MYEEGEKCAQSIFEDALKRNHRSHQEIGLRHSSYHLLRLRKPELVESISKYLIENNYIRPNTIEAWDLDIRTVQIQLLQNLPLETIELLFEKVMATFSSNSQSLFKGFPHEIIILSTFYDQFYFFFQRK